MAMPVIGFLNSASAASFAPFVAGFRRGLSEEGYIEGTNVAVEYRWADEHYDRLPGLAADLVRRQVSVIAANQVSVEAAKAATGTIPIVFTTALDPVKLGLVASLNRPGGNLTGVTTLNVELLPKRLELLHQLRPAATTLALLLNPTSPSADTLSRDAHAAARGLGLELHVVEASSERVAASMRQEQPRQLRAPRAACVGQTGRLLARTVPFHQIDPISELSAPPVLQREPAHAVAAEPVALGTGDLR
jgi:putative ABC transport system substrate-binding protein